MSASLEISLHNFGQICLDGGSMFGSVPKELWSKKIPADEKNRICLATNSLIVKTDGRCFLIDTGNGDKYDKKFKEIYLTEYLPLPDPGIVTDVILTHLHFDHAGGISYYGPKSELMLTYPKANVFLQKENYTNAAKPNLKERASYLKENIDILDKANLTLLDGSEEICPGIRVHRIDGHTHGQQYVEIRTEKDTYFFATDLIPTHHHLPLPYHLGYDMCAQTTIREKQEFLEKVMLIDGIVVFQHDTKIQAAKIQIDKKGHYAVKEEVKLPQLL
jgi:glyoxylase-like metal-dependent hydrolase (beta-lactamase superfamily II)